MLQVQENRLQFLDVLRGIAAVSVMIEHMGEKLFPEFVYFTSSYFQLGQFGVVLFFLCSGFIIPYSLERSNQLKTFWIRRFFRLYPLYWINIGVAVSLAYSVSSGDKPSFLTIIANMTMVQKFLGKPDIVGLYWTLNTEMLFYVLCSLLFVLSLFQRSLAVASIFFMLAIISSSSSLIAGIHIPGWGMFFNLFTMFIGTIMYRFYKHQISGRTFAFTYGFSFILILIVCLNVFLHDNNPQYLGTHSFIPMLSAWTIAYVMFWGMLNMKIKISSTWLKYLGTISYSIYLMHPLIIEVIPVVEGRIFTFLLWSMSTIGIATLTYFGIEKPCISLGRRLTASKPALSIKTPITTEL